MSTVRNILTVSVMLLAFTAASSALALSDTDIDALGIGDLGFVQAGVDFNYQHVFDPALDRDITAIDNVSLSIGAASLVGTTWSFMGEETFDLNATTWSIGRAQLEIFRGDILADIDIGDLLAPGGGVVNITVSTGNRDGLLLWSRMVTDYQWEPVGGGGTGPGVNAIPEPSAALVFAFGALIVTGSVRRNRS